MKLSFTLLFISLLVVPLIAQTKDAEGFVLVKKKEPVWIYERWITFPGKKPAVEAREVKSVFIIQCSKYAILKLLKDELKIKIWQEHVSKFKVYPRSDTTHWQEYSYHDIPWPVSDQDHFLEYRLTEKDPEKNLFVTFKSIEDLSLAPVEKGVTRMELAGSWTLEQINPQQTKVTYRILSMPIGIPRIFTDPVIRSNLMSTIEALTELAEKKNQITN